MKVPWIPKRSNQSILKEINPELEGLMVKLQYFGYLIPRLNSFEKTLMLENIEGRKRREKKRMRWLDGIMTQWTMNLRKLGDSEGQESLVCCSPWSHKELDIA